MGSEGRSYEYPAEPEGREKPRKKKGDLKHGRNRQKEGGRDCDQTTRKNECQFAWGA